MRPLSGTNTSTDTNAVAEKFLVVTLVNRSSGERYI